jgi:mannose-6-phosphate isomerase-like protein (cupin superfamily)
MSVQTTSMQTSPVQAKAATVVLPGVGQPMNILGHQATLKLTSSGTKGDGYLFDLVTPPGLGIPPHVHQIEDEYIYVLEGTFEVFLDGKTYEAGQGALIYFPRTIAHGFRNIGAGAGRTLWTVVPGGNFEKFFAELGVLSMEAAPDMQKVVALFNRYGMEVLPPPGL